MTARPMQYDEGLLASPVLQRIIERIPACIARAALPLWFRGEGFSSFPFRINDVGCDPGAHLGLGLGLDHWWVARRVEQTPRARPRSARKHVGGGLLL